MMLGDPLHIGVTGTQDGATPTQLHALRELIIQRVEAHTDATSTPAVTLHHGDCVGVDADAHALVFGLPPEFAVRVVIHPPDNDIKRAFCSAGDALIEVREPKPYLSRDRDIVDGAQVLIALPKTVGEQLRSGTWATVRYARGQGKPIFIINPDGSVAR